MFGLKRTQNGLKRIFSILLMALCIAAFSGLDVSAKLTVSKIVKTKKGYGYVVVKNTGKYGVRAGSYRLGYNQWGKRSSACGKYIPAGGKVTYGFKFPASKFSIAGAKGKKGKGRKGYKTQYCDNPDFYVGNWFFVESQSQGQITDLKITANEDGTFNGYYALAGHFDYSDGAGPYEMTGSIENGKLILSSAMTTLVCSKAGNRLQVLDKHPDGGVKLMMRE